MRPLQHAEMKVEVERQQWMKVGCGTGFMSVYGDVVPFTFALTGTDI